MLHQTNISPGFNQNTKKSNCVARALFDNIAETQDEIAFRKGELLTVLEQNTNGLEGWWLCCLRGRQGIAPGNRLRLLPGVYDHTGLGFAGGPASTGALNGSSRSLAQPPSTPSSTGSSGNASDKDTLNNSNSGTPTHSRRRSWHANPNKVVMPQRIGDVYLYDVPRSIGNSSDETDSGQRNYKMSTSAYDVPPNAIGNYNVPHSPRMVKNTLGTYDHPRAHSLPQMTYDTPKSIPKLMDTDCTNHDYEIPPSEYDFPQSYNKVPGTKQQSYNENNSNYDIPMMSHQIITSSDNYVIPASQLIMKKLRKDLGQYNNSPMSNRSSGVSLVSTVSSPSLSPACSQSSLNASLSLSSLGGSNSNRSSLEQQSHELYDIAPVPRPVKILDEVNDETYDVPTNNSPANLSLVYDTPPMPRPAAARVKPLLASNDEVYDVPPQVTRDVSPSLVEDNRRHSSSSSDNSRNSKEFPATMVGIKELPIDLDAAMEILVNVQREVTTSIAKLFGFVSSNKWRERENVQGKMHDIENTCHKLQTSIAEFLTFAQGALANSTYAQDKSLSRKLSKLIAPLIDTEKIVETAVKSLDQRGWQIAKDEETSTDELDQLIACARGMVEDVRQVASFIQGNSSLIFKRAKRLTDLNGTDKDTSKPPIAPKPDLKSKMSSLSLSPEKDVTGKTNTLQDRPLPPVPNSNVTVQIPDAVDKTHEPPPVASEDGPNDYDYVNLEPKESVEKERDEIKASLPTTELKRSFENVVKQSEIPVEDATNTLTKSGPTRLGPGPSTLDMADSQLLRFYSCQVETHVKFLNDAIDTFFATVKSNQPPKVFIGHSKFVVISAHKLVFIGDTIQRNARNAVVKDTVSRGANSLCEALKTLVSNTKSAALQYPSVEYVQKMIDSVVDVSHLANDLKLKILQATRL